MTDTVVYTYSANGLRVGQWVDGDETTFAWDWATGVPEMLSAGDDLYLVGHETLGSWDGSDWSYYLSDALGSVRQTTDGAGEVIAEAREWTPYGVEVGEAQEGLGYAGEWGDGYIEFTYLRARWYGNRSGQFVSPDPIVPDYLNPQSVNAYVYALGNPIRYTDPTGKYARYCYSMEQKTLTRRTDRRTPCAANASMSVDVDTILRRYDELPRPKQTMWVELDRAWGFSVYPCLDLKEYPPSEEQYFVTLRDTGESVSLPMNWIVNVTAPEVDDPKTVRHQGSGKLPDEYYGGRIVRWNAGNPEITDHHVRGGRVGRWIEDLAFRVVAAPSQFPNQGLLYLPGLEASGVDSNANGLVSVEDSGGQITWEGGRLDVYVGLSTDVAAVAKSNAWGGWERPQTVFVLVDLPQATWWRLPDTPYTHWGRWFGRHWGEAFCYEPEQIDGVEIRKGAGTIIQ